MEGSNIVSAIICFLLLILLPLKTNSNNFNTGLVQFYNTSIQSSSANTSLFSTYQVFPYIVPYTNLLFQNLILSLSSFSYDGTSNITCNRGAITGTSFMLNCSRSVTSVSYLVFDYAPSVSVQRSTFSSDASSKGIYKFELADIFKNSLALQKYKYKSQLNAYAFLTSIQISTSALPGPISFVSVKTMTPAKSGNNSLANAYPYFIFNYSSNVKNVSIFYMLVIENTMPFYWSFNQIQIDAIQQQNKKQFGRFFGINQISFINSGFNSRNIGVLKDNTVQNDQHHFKLNFASTQNNSMSISSLTGVFPFNSSINLSFLISESLQVTFLNLQLMQIRFCGLFSTISNQCVTSCDPSLQMRNRIGIFNAKTYTYCTSLAPINATDTNNSSNSNNCSTNNSGQINQTNPSNLSIIGCKQIGFIQNSGTFTSGISFPQYQCKVCENSYTLITPQNEQTPSCICDPGFYMNSSGTCIPCQKNQVKCSFLANLEANFISNVDEQQHIQITIYLSKIYTYVQNISQDFYPILTINSLQYVPQVDSLQWNGEYELTFNVTDYPIEIIYRIGAYFQSRLDLNNSFLNSQYILVKEESSGNKFFSKAQTNTIILRRPAASQAIVQTLQPYINTINSSSSTLILIAPFLSDKISIFSLLQTNSMIYCLKFLKITKQSKFRYQRLMSTVNNMFIFQTIPLLKLFGDNQAIDIPNMSTLQKQALGEFQSQNLMILKQDHNFFQQSINHVVFLFLQVAFIQLLIFLLSFKLCFLIKWISKEKSRSLIYEKNKEDKPTCHTQPKEEDSMKVICLQESTQNNLQIANQKQNNQQKSVQQQKDILLSYKFSDYILLPNLRIKWLQRARLDEEFASFKHKMVFFSYELNKKKYVFYSSYIISQLISQFIFAYYQFISPVADLWAVFQLIYVIVLVFLLVGYPTLLVAYDSLHLLKIVQIIYKLNGHEDKLKDTQKFSKFKQQNDNKSGEKLKTNAQIQDQHLYRHQQIFVYFLFIYFQNVFFALSILLGKNLACQTFPIALIFAFKLLFMWKRIKTIDFVKTILLICLFSILALSSLTQIDFYNEQIEQLMIYIVMAIVFIQYFKLFKLILIGLITFIKKKKVQSKVKKSTDKILQEEPRLERNNKKFQKIKQLRNLKQSLNQQLYILRKANQKRRNNLLDQQLKVITTSDSENVKKPDIFDGIQQILQFDPHNPLFIKNDNENQKKQNKQKQEHTQINKKTDINDLVEKIFQKE